MKATIYRFLYYSLSFLSGHSNSKFISHLKIMGGGTLLILTLPASGQNKKVGQLPTDSLTGNITKSPMQIPVNQIPNKEEVLEADDISCYMIANALTKMPEYPGGMPELMKYIKENTTYPITARQLKIQGRVIVQFTIDEEDGSITDPKVVRSIDVSIDSAAMEIVRKMPKWKPGMNNNGKAIKVKYTLPIAFELPPEE